MGIYINIAEVAGLLFVAYLVGWLIGYIAKRIAAGPAKAAAPAIPAGRLAAARGEVQPEDALVRAPVVAAVTSAAPMPHVPAMAAPLEPVKARVTNDGAVLVEATPTMPPEPVSALNTLKSLSETIPLLPVETVPLVEEIAEAKADAEDSAPEAVERPAAVEAIAEPALPAAVEQPESVLPAILDPAEPSVVSVEAPPTPAESARPAEPVVPVEAVMPAEMAVPVEVVPATPVEPLPPAMPTSVPGVAWAGAINGHEASKFEPPKAAPVVETVAAGRPVSPTEPFAPTAAVEELPPAEPSVEEAPPGLDIALLASLAEELKVEAASAVVASVPDAAPIAAQIDEPQPVAKIAEPVPAVMPAEVPVAPPEQAPTSVTVAEQAAPLAPAAPAHVEFDEGAAMRAIEGGWSRRAARAMSDSPEMTDVSAAVSAAQTAVEQILARNGLDPAQSETRAQASFGKPLGLPKPREGGRDDLKRINGLGPLDESTLNNLGIFHYDQIETWDEREVLWLENHAFARGRIGREDWQAQARDLTARGLHAARANR